MGLKAHNATALLIIETLCKGWSRAFMHLRNRTAVYCAFLRGREVILEALPWWPQACCARTSDINSYRWTEVLVESMAGTCANDR